MHSKGSHFTLGVWGLRVCSLDVASASATVRNRPQPSATVRNRSQVWGPYGRAYGKFCRGGYFCFVSCGRRGIFRHSDVFYNVLKIVLRGKRNTFATFSNDAWQFSWQGQHIGRVHCYFSWRVQHFKCVVLSVFRKSHWQVGVKWWQGTNSVAGVTFSNICWKLTEASHKISVLRLQNFQIPRKIRRTTSILKLRTIKIRGSLARNSRFGAATCLVSSRWCSCGFA